MKSLNGSELAGYIKERQAKEVRRLKQANGMEPSLAIVQDHPDPVIDTYVKLKVKYGLELDVAVDVFMVKNNELKKTVDRLNNDHKYHGIVVQLPLSNPDMTEEVVNLISSSKDIDGLGSKSEFTPATAQAIMWLLSGYGVEISSHNVVIVGQGKLVGVPLAKLMRETGVEPVVLDESSSDLSSTLKTADIIVTATGQPGLIKTDMVKAGAYVIDAGTTSENGQIRGDVEDALYERTDISITPRRGGVGPLTVASLFDNLLRATRARIAAP